MSGEEDMSNKIIFNEILPVEKGIIFSSSDGSGLYFWKSQEKEARLITSFQDDLDGQGTPYKVLAKIGNKIFLPPCLAENIVVYDLESKNRQVIRLDRVYQGQNGLCKFWTSIVYNEYIYFIGHYYPAIIKLNTCTMDLVYLTDWVRHVEKRRRLKDSPYWGIGIVQGDTALFPCCCANVVLKLDLRTDETEICEIQTDIRGFNGICFSEGKYWLPSRHSYEVAIWSKDTRSVEILELEAGEKNTDLVFFRPPLIVNKRLYLFPTVADHAYYIDTSDKEVRRIKRVDEILDSDGDDSANCSKIASPPALVDGKIYFITEKDKIWHIYNPETESLTNFSVQIDIYGKKAIKKQRALKDFYNAVREKNETFTFTEEELFSCGVFCDFTRECRNKTDAFSPQILDPRKNIGQSIYSKLKI